MYSVCTLHITVYTQKYSEKNFSEFSLIGLKILTTTENKTKQQQQEKQTKKIIKVLN